MKYMLLITADTGPDATQNECSVEEWLSFDAAAKDAGVLVDSAQLADLTTATAVHVDSAGNRTITDGPFTESREVLGGYYVIDVPNLDVALDWAARCPGARDGGSLVVRPVAEF
ncbi:YciI family protein [Actinoalloteichus hymeniacidonis]|uniref:YCII-related domain-containing protein n=1 Tax=Actinoalloteichus hymeniacidonis TaxID=340345 RepID=A0AAC9HMG2_9PSEU|nr:YciI family protein [Actinoalloteichus hymeniacidonis]AOS61945.1 hypothetical protein TL08_05590 [Actinoalloteichus hymeniacidonis]MBB5910035.1 hypothetical protein [Actinoalloteichus hymeniacidonis]